MGKKSKQTVSAAEKKIQLANAVENIFIDFAPFQTYSSSNESTYTLKSCPAALLSPHEANFCFELFKQNMKHLYETSNWGYNEPDKRKELTDPEARFLIVSNEHGKQVAFVHYRFVLDEGDEVVYVYEIQVSSSAQRAGIGKRLMQIVELVGRKYEMKFIVLTVFKANTSAMEFYRKKMKFEIDESSPSASGDLSESYEILSKDIQRKH